MSSKVSKEFIFSLVSTIVLVLSHVAILLAIVLSWRYYSIYPSIFGSIVAIILCLMVIVDIIFFVGFNNKDLFLKVVSLVLSVFLFIGGTFGSYYIGKVNKTVNDVLDTKGNEYETYSGVFVYDKNKNKFSQLSDLSGKKVGMLVESTNGLTYIATNILNKEKVDVGIVDFKSNAELMQGLQDGKVDAIVITSGYRSIYQNDENSTFVKYVDELVDFYPFSEELKVNSNKRIKNIASEPFNVLLIGYSRTDIGSPVGLADSIILATINPLTYTVSMMSIARDSFVPISCYGGEYDKINSGRSTSRACFIETVEDFLDMDIDYWMELDYLGLVAIVNEIGGIYINNPVDFTLDGIHVPAGENVFADGQMALQFCRERHHMPNGDFDRQQHQKEVIISIAKKFIESGDVSLALRAMEVASGDGDENSRFMWTNFTLNQLTSVFNLLLNTKNYTSLNTFDLVDFQTLRMTGFGGVMYYSYPMRLPLWVYLIYKGSYDESMKHVNAVMGNYSVTKQDYSFEFSCMNPYVRPALYSTEYDNTYIYTPDPMPAFWINFDGLSLEEALSWASANGVSLDVNIITADDSRFDESLVGTIVSQSPRYGSLISEYKSGTVTVMGEAEVDESLLVPDMFGWKASEAYSWANENGVTWNSGNPSSGVVTEQSCAPRSMIKACEVLSIKAKELVTVRVSQEPSDGGKATVNGKERDSVEKGTTVTLEATPNKGYKFVSWQDGNTEKNRKVKIDKDIEYIATFADDGHTHKWEEVSRVEATCTEAALIKYKCSICDKEKEETSGEPLGHKWTENGVTDATCTSPRIVSYLCTRCQSTKTESEGSELGHEWTEISRTEPTCDQPGSVRYECNRCHTTKDEEIPATGDCESGG